MQLPAAESGADPGATMETQRVSLSNPKQRDLQAAVPAGPRLSPSASPLSWPPRTARLARPLPPPPVWQRGQEGVTAHPIHPRAGGGGSITAEITVCVFVKTQRACPPRAVGPTGRARLPRSRRLRKVSQLSPVWARLTPMQPEPSWSSPVQAEHPGCTHTRRRRHTHTHTRPSPPTRPWRHGGPSGAPALRDKCSDCCTPRCQPEKPPAGRAATVPECAERASCRCRR